MKKTKKSKRKMSVICFYLVDCDEPSYKSCGKSGLNEPRSPGDASVARVSTPFGLEKAKFELCFDSLLSQGLVFDTSLSGMPSPRQMGIGRTPEPRERINIFPLAKRAMSFIPEVEQVVKSTMKK